MTRTSSLERRVALQSSKLAALERMIEIRAFEDLIVSLFADGVIHGTTHTCQGQEAVSVGIALAIGASDSVAATYRGHGIALALGLSPFAVAAEIMGRQDGSVGGVGGSMHLCDPDVGLLPTAAIVGAGIPIAVGAALRAQTLGTGDVAVAIFGDGASNIGAFHEGLNLASIWDLPVVFVCENNLYGEYSRIDRTTSIADIADRAAAYSMPGHIVDGQDVEAVADAVREASLRARDGAGPSLLEMKTYRYAGHSRADTAPYRRAGELDLWLKRDPIHRFARRLQDQGEISEQDLHRIAQETKVQVDEAIDRALSSPFPSPSAMFSNVTSEGTVE